MYNFEYHRPSSVAEVLKLMADNSEAKLLAGGQTLIPTLKQRLAQPSDLIDLSGVSDLKGVKVAGNVVTVGAMTTHFEVETSSDVIKTIPSLASLAGRIGDMQVRNRGTIGGSISNADPAADYPAAIIALGATVKTNKREIKGDDFFESLFTTALQPDEIVVSVSFPAVDKGAYIKFLQPASHFALVGVFVAKKGNDVRVAVTGAGPCVFRVHEMEAALSKSFTPQAIEKIAVPADGLNEDIHASRPYRAHLINVMARRAVTACA